MPSFSQDEFQITDTQKHTCDTSVQDWAMGLNISCAHYVYVYNGCRSQEMMQYEPWHNPATLVESFVSHVHVFFLSLMQAFLNSASVCTIMYWCELSSHSKQCKNTSLHTSTLISNWQCVSPGKWLVTVLPFSRCQCCPRLSVTIYFSLWHTSSNEATLYIVISTGPKLHKQCLTVFIRQPLATLFATEIWQASKFLSCHDLSSVTNILMSSISQFLPFIPYPIFFITHSFAKFCVTFTKVCGFGQNKSISIVARVTIIR